MELTLCYYYSPPDYTTLEKRFHARFDSHVSFPRIYSVSGFSKPRLPVITSEDFNRIQLFKWGLIPSWVKDEETAKNIQTRTLNARAETIHEKDSFRNIITKQRCLMVSFDESQMEAYSVSRCIKTRNVSRNVPEVIKPMTYPELPTLPNL